MNYGAIGFVVGHEITHGFDDQGSQKDGEGNLLDWWEPATKKRYLEKAQCIIDQYGNYTVEVEGETLNLNGINAQGENIADNGGIKEALRTYNRIAEKLVLVFFITIYFIYFICHYNLFHNLLFVLLALRYFTRCKPISI